MTKPKPQKQIGHKQQTPSPALASAVSWWRREWVLGVVLCFVTLISYQPAWHGAPIWDDDRHITRPELRSLDGLARMWTHLGATQQYYPLTHSIFWLEYHLWGDSPTGYHMVNILLHVASALLLVRILGFLRVPGAWLAGALFALHPVQVESVAWITELKNTLSGVFFFLAALAYLLFDCERKRSRYACAAAFFIAGLMTKSVIATLPVSLLAVLWWKRGAIAWKKDIVPLLPFFAVGIASGLFTAWVEHKFIISEDAQAFTFSFIERCLIAGRAFWFYLAKIVRPIDLIFVYPRWLIDHAVWWQYLFPLSGLALFFLFWGMRRRMRAPLTAFLYFAATLFPVLGFFNVYPFRYSFVADHFQYLACVAPLAMAAAGIERMFSQWVRFLKPFGYAILMVTLCVLTWKQCGMYIDSETLYRATVLKNPGCAMAHHNLGVLLADAGRADEALLHYRTSVEIRPDFAESWNNLGKELLLIGQFSEAETDLRKALSINPKMAEAHNNLGILLEKTGRKAEAMDHYRKALEINPLQGNAHNNLGTLLAVLGQTDEAEAHLLKAVEINPEDINARNNLGILLARSNRIDEAMVHFRKALEINPDDMSGLLNLSAAYENTGQGAQAIALLERALPIAKSSGDTALVHEFQERLERLTSDNR
jgi:protein O-mannosyl-transferase